ncbi:hypothetical protein FGO68_gene14857 [Halteria grandinella]|uniref:Uncharacterized protein n=1 Tax=Halteria grandinella TaxID=5974 RepID=A0A8J8SYM9_HALGN|nr:hypothetical protein FGO68_gene14857 [Halteria grandinella]
MLNKVKQLLKSVEEDLEESKEVFATKYDVKQIETRVMQVQGDHYALREQVSKLNTNVDQLRLACTALAQTVQEMQDEPFKLLFPSFYAIVATFLLMAYVLITVNSGWQTALMIFFFMGFLGSAKTKKSDDKNAKKEEPKKEEPQKEAPIINEPQDQPKQKETSSWWSS